nr:hypothetical protein JUJ52_03755 [Virgibacillus sp. AGTR]
MSVSEKTEINLVALEELDIPGLIALSAAVGWDYDKHEIRTVMSSGKVYGHKNMEGKIVSSAAIIPYGCEGLDSKFYLFYITGRHTP